MKRAACILALLSSSTSEETDETENMVYIDAGLVYIGDDDTTWNKNADGDGPQRQINVKPFWIDETSVTNEQFKKFVRATKYKTEAEQYGWSFVLSSLITDESKKDSRTESIPDAKHWLATYGAYWRMPEGKGSSTKSRSNHPVVHVGYSDAWEYCKWLGKRLPYESEWETAARGGASTKSYPWGSKPLKNNNHMMNIWQGTFPSDNSEEDGYHGTAPVDAYPPNTKGLYGMLGNVWEWTQTLYSKGNREKEELPKFVLKGGSFVDSIDGTFNHFTRTATRMGNTPDSGSHNTGFRCAKDGESGTPNADRPRGPGGKAAMQDQDMLQQIIAEKGVEGLQDYMKEVGMGGSVMTPNQLKEQQEKLKDQRTQLESEAERYERIKKEMDAERRAEEEL